MAAGRYRPGLGARRLGRHLDPADAPFIGTVVGATVSTGKKTCTVPQPNNCFFSYWMHGTWVTTVLAAPHPLHILGTEVTTTTVDAGAADAAGVAAATTTKGVGEAGTVAGAAVGAADTGVRGGRHRRRGRAGGATVGARHRARPPVAHRRHARRCVRERLRRRSCRGGRAVAAPARNTVTARRCAPRVRRPVGRERRRPRRPLVAIAGALPPHAHRGRAHARRRGRRLARRRPREAFVGAGARHGRPGGGARRRS